MVCLRLGLYHLWRPTAVSGRAVAGSGSSKPSLAAFHRAILLALNYPPRRPEQVIMSESVQERVLRVIAVKQRLPLESVTPDSTFEELNIDSLDRLNLLFELEGEFDIQIDDEEAKKVSNMREMIAGIQHLVDAKEQKEQATELS